MIRSRLIGLTGSIGMGKSTVSQMFRERDVPVWDADAAVHRIYSAGGAAVEPMRQLRPEAVTETGVDRMALSEWIAQDPEALRQIERIVHPLVAQDRQAFIARTDADIIVLDIPLLFETGVDAEMDMTVVVSAPLHVQRARVLARPGMTEEKFERILAMQMPDAEKRNQADIVVPSVSIDETECHVDRIVDRLRHA